MISGALLSMKVSVCIIGSFFSIFSFLYEKIQEETIIISSNNPYTNPTDQELKALRNPFKPFAYDFIGISYTFSLLSLSFTKSLNNVTVF